MSDTLLLSIQFLPVRVVHTKPLNNIKDTGTYTEVPDTKNMFDACQATFPRETCDCGKAIIQWVP